MVIYKPLLISNPYELWVFVLQAAILRGKNFNIVCYAQTFQLQIVVPAMLMETIDCYHFIQLSVTLTLAGRHKVSTMQNLLASFSSTLFISGCGGEAVQVEDLNFNLEWDLFNQASKNFDVSMYLDIYKLILFKLGMMIDIIELWDLILVQNNLDLDSRSQICKKAKTSTPIILQSSKSNSMEFGTLLTLFSLMNLILILSRLITSMGENPTYMISSKTRSIWLMFRHLPIIFFQTRYDHREHILILVWMILTFIQGQSCLINQKLVHSFHNKFVNQFW